MGIEEFDPISRPKKLKSAKKLEEELPENKKLVLEAVPTEREVREVKEIEEK